MSHLDPPPCAKGTYISRNSSSHQFTFPLCFIWSETEPRQDFCGEILPKYKVGGMTGGRQTLHYCMGLCPTWRTLPSKQSIRTLNRFPLFSSKRLRHFWGPFTVPQYSRLKITAMSAKGCPLLRLGQGHPQQSLTTNLDSLFF